MRPLALLMLLAGCAPSPLGPEPLVLRTWDVPDGFAPRLVSALNRALTREDGAGGRATEGPGSSLVVVAPASVLGGVDDLVARTLAAPPTPTGRNVDVEYWLVRGIAAEAPSRGAGLEVLAPALDAIQATDGPLALTLTGSRRLRTFDGERGSLSDPTADISQVVSVEPGTDRVLADVKIGVARATNVETRLLLKDGAVAVLSQSGVEDPAGPSTLYVIVRPRIVAGQ